MPKVTEEYIQNKKRMIVQTTYDLCLKKNLCTVTMQDVINATGLSQGGIYRFYKNIDAILADVILYMRQRESIKGKIDEILAKENECSVEEISRAMFDMLADFMTRELMGIMKIDFELSMLAVNEPNRVYAIIDGIKQVANSDTGSNDNENVEELESLNNGESIAQTKASKAWEMESKNYVVGNKEYLMMRMIEYLTRQLQQGRIHPRVSLEEVFSFISSAFTGIVSTCITYNCYQEEANPLKDYYQPKIQLKLLSDNVLYMLGKESGNNEL